MLAYGWIALFKTVLKLVCVKVVKSIFIVCRTLIAYHYVASNTENKTKMTLRECLPSSFEERQEIQR